MEDTLTGFEVHGTSNPVGRTMGEVAKRCKRDGLRCSKDGLEVLLQLYLVKYAVQAATDHFSMSSCSGQFTARFVAPFRSQPPEVKSKRFVESDHGFVNRNVICIPTRIEL